jgi:hypothetical protein
MVVILTQQVAQRLKRILLREHVNRRAQQRGDSGDASFVDDALSVALLNGHQLEGARHGLCDAGNSRI